MTTKQAYFKVHTSLDATYYCGDVEYIDCLSMSEGKLVQLKDINNKISLQCYLFDEQLNLVENSANEKTWNALGDARKIFVEFSIACGEFVEICDYISLFREEIVPYKIVPHCFDDDNDSFEDQPIPESDENFTAQKDKFKAKKEKLQALYPIEVKKHYSNAKTQLRRYLTGDE